MEIPSANRERKKTDGPCGRKEEKGQNQASGPAETKDEKNFFPEENLDYKSQMKACSDELIDDQVRRQTDEPADRTDIQNFLSASEELAEQPPKRHLAEEMGNESFASSATEMQRLPFDNSEPFRNNNEVSKKNFCLDQSNENERNKKQRNETFEEIKKQNSQLLQVLLKVQKVHAAEKKRFNEILFGIDRALSSLPVRLEKIRVRNLRNLSIIQRSRLPSGDAGTESSPLSDESATAASGDSSPYLSTRMNCLLRKMEQLNELVRGLKNDEGKSSPIELVLDSELCAISLLKKEVRSTKKQIENNRTDTDTVTSCEESHKELAEDSCSKAKNSFSNELNKASNFKIFENHMILQEEALNLLTRKIKETEEALEREAQAKEVLRRENEALTRELSRLQPRGPPGEGPEGSDTNPNPFKLKPEPESELTTNRPYRLIKELKAKLEEREKSLIAWKSKCSRLEAAGDNKNNIIENEKKKNFELEATVKNLKTQNKSISSHLNSLQFLNKQLRDQIETLKRQTEILSNERENPMPKPMERRLKIDLDQQMSDQNDLILSQEAIVKKVEKDFENKSKELRMECEKELEELRFRLLKSQNTNEEFKETFKRLLVKICSAAMETEVRCINHPSHNRIREILNISPADLQVLYSAYMKSVTEKGVEKLFAQFGSIVEGGRETFSEALSSWMFDFIVEKLSDHRTEAHDER